MTKQHFMYIGIGVAVLLIAFFALGNCEGCRARMARLTQGKRQTEIVDVSNEQKEI